MKYILFAILLTLSSCSLGIHPNDAINFTPSDIKTVGDAIEYVDSKRLNGDPSRMILCAEGYEPPSVREMIELGRLEIVEQSAIKPFILPVITGGNFPLIFGEVNEHYCGIYGDVYSAKITYTSGVMSSLVHELQHAQGFVGLEVGRGDYTIEQKAIMWAEGVYHWYDTSYYKNEPDTYHWNKWKEMDDSGEMDRILKQRELNKINAMKQWNGGK